MNFYIKTEDQEYGPFTSDQLRQAVASGKLKSAHYVKKETTGEWIEASRIHGLFGRDNKTVESADSFLAGAETSPPLESPAPPLPEVQQQTNETFYKDEGIIITREYFKFPNTDGHVDSFAIRNIAGHGIEVQRPDRRSHRVVMGILVFFALMALLTCFGSLAGGEWKSFFAAGLGSLAFAGVTYLYYLFVYLRLFDRYFLVVQTNAGPCKTIWSKHQSDISEMIGALELAMRQHN